MVALVFVERLLEDVGAPGFFTLQPLDCRSEILNRRRSFGFFMINDGLEFSVDLESGVAARALDFDQLTFAFCHTGILTQLQTR